MELILISIFLFISTLVYTLLFLFNRKQYELAKRMKLYTTSAVQTQKQEEDILSKPFSQRVIRPLIKSLSKFISRFTPAQNREKLQHSLQLAGNPWDFKANEFLALQYLVVFLAVICSWSLFALARKDISQQILFALMAGLTAFIAMKAYLSNRTRKRMAEIQKELPGALDLLCVSVEAGLGFDSGLHHVIEKSKGVLSHEFVIALQEMQMGKPRRKALRDLGNRTGVEDIQLFVGALIQADQLGVSIAKILRTQSEQVRMKHRQRIEEKAMKAPVKMLIPMILFIFPTIFSVLLGPVVIKIMDTFMNK
jgi:tight adherence protein C